MSASLQVQEKIYKELQEKYNKLQEVADGKRKERSESYQSEFGKIKVELEKVFKAFNIDSEVSICMHLSYIVVFKTVLDCV